MLDPKVALWKNVEISDNPEVSAYELKILIRKGIPEIYRTKVIFEVLTRKVWKSVTGYTQFHNERPFHYEEVQKEVFGSKVPSVILKIPTFGGTIKYEDFHLNEKQKSAVTRILCCFAVFLKVIYQSSATI